MFFKNKNDAHIGGKKILIQNTVRKRGCTPGMYKKINVELKCVTSGYPA